VFFSFNFIKGGGSDCSALPPGTLFGPIDIETHGAPVQSVAWLCGGCDSDLETYAAIAGFESEKAGEEGVVLRVYKLDDSGTPDLTQEVTQTGTNLYAVDWCCSGTTKYIAVGGMADSDGYEVHVYRFDEVVPDLSLVASFTHTATVYSVAWLCGCDQCVTGTPLLAIGGDPASSDNADFRILGFDPVGSALTQKSKGFHGARVNSLDWCCQIDKNPILALGGAPTDCTGINFRIYRVSCTGGYTQLSYGKFPYNFPMTDLTSTGTDVFSVKWCCEADVKYPLLAVGGHIEDENNLAVYRFAAFTQSLSRLARIEVPITTVYSVDWNESCDCSYLAAGGGGFGDCENIFVYNKDGCTLDLKSKEKHDDNVKSLAWCKKGTCYYLLVGTEEDNWTWGMETEQEIALFQGSFCVPAPVPICDRSETLEVIEKQIDKAQTANKYRKERKGTAGSRSFKKHNIKAKESQFRRR